MIGALLIIATAIGALALSIFVTLGVALVMVKYAIWNERR